MPIQLTRYLGISPGALSERGVFDAFLGIDNKLFVDPNLLRDDLNIPEFQGARKALTAYFSQVIRLLKVSKRKGDPAWQEALSRLTFKEENGTALGYAGAGGHGRAVGPKLADILATRAKEIINFGIEDPEVFELIGLFQENIGADLLSDMAVSILGHQFLEYTQRITAELSLQPTKEFTIKGTKWTLPLLTDGERPLILVPARVLSTLPVALNESEISEVAEFNKGVRDMWNKIIADAHKEQRGISKEQIRHVLFAHPQNLSDLVKVYRGAAGHGYDFENDPEGLLSWNFIGRSAAEASPLDISIHQPRTIEELRTVLDLIIAKFKKNIEENRLYEFLYKENGKPKHELFAQRLFFALADAYCEANNVDLSREPNAGNGPVDFKLSSGYRARILVEVKKSSNSDLLNGFERQLPEYEKSEATNESVYLVLRVTESDSLLKSLRALREKKEKEGSKTPRIVVIDARKKASASKAARKKDRR